MSRTLLSPVFNQNWISIPAVLFKTIALSFLVIITSSFNSKRPNDSIDTLYAQANGRLSKEGAAFIRQNFIYHTEPCRSITGDGGGLWRCIYKDGWVVYNCFKSCRGSIEASRYFLGIGSGDCDAFAIVNNKKEKVCYPNDAGFLYRYHGQVVAIERFRSCL